MKVGFSRDEVYPVYTMSDKTGIKDFSIELTEDEIKWIKETEKEFDKVQGFLRSMDRDMS